ncbi:MAG: hypothetical protein ACOCTM_00460 [Bacteroidota bacterium]
MTKEGFRRAIPEGNPDELPGFLGRDHHDVSATGKSTSVNIKFLF